MKAVYIAIGFVAGVIFTASVNFNDIFGDVSPSDFINTSDLHSISRDFRDATPNQDVVPDKLEKKVKHLLQ